MDYLTSLTSTLKPFLWTKGASEILVYPTSNGNTTNLTVDKCFSKAVHFQFLCQSFPLLSACTGFQTALFLTRVSNSPLRSGRHSVGGYREAMPSLSSRYHPKSNNQTKRANQSLESALQGVLTRHPASWTFVPACWCWPPLDVPIIVQLYILRLQNRMKIFNSSAAAAAGVPVLNQYHSRECKIYT